MGSAVTTQEIASKHSVTAYYHKPASSSAQYLTRDGGTTFHWLDMSTFDAVGFSACNAELTGNGLTHLEIWAADDTSATNATVIVASATLAGTTIEKGGFVECTADQIKEISAANSLKLRYVTAKITLANSSDTAAVTAIRTRAKAPQLNLTPATM